MDNPNKNIDRALTVFIIVLAMLTSWLMMHDWINSIFPLGDELSLISESRGNPKNWFFSGYSQYFNAYPEFFRPYTNFIRPVANFFYFIFRYDSFPFGSQLYLVNYGMLSAFCAGIYSISRSLGNQKFFSGALALAAFIAPPFWGSEAPIFPTFALDGLAATFCLFGVWFAFGKKWILGLILLLIAVFTKETALPIVAATAAYFAITRKWNGILGCLGILAIFGLIRFAAFGAMGGAYSFNHTTLFGSVLKAGTSLLFLPSTIGELAYFKKIFLGGEWIGIEPLFIIGNIVCLGFIFYYLFSRKEWLIKIASVQLNLNKLELSQNQRAIIFILISTAFSGMFFMMVGGGTRFGFVFYAQFLLLVAAINSHTYKNGLLTLLLLMASVDFSHSLDVLAAEKDVYFFKYKQAKELSVLLRDIKNIEKPVYIINDFISGYASIKNVSATLGGNSTLFRGSSLEIAKCQLSELKLINLEKMQNSDSVKEIKTQIPPCAKFQFEGADPIELLGKFKDGNIFRNEHISYSLPAAILSQGRISKIENISNLGTEMSVKLQNSSIIYFDFSSEKWNYIK